MELLHRFLDRVDGEEQISVSLLTVLHDAGWLCGDESSLFQHPYIFSYCVSAHSSSLSDGFETGPALISTSVLAEKQVGNILPVLPVTDQAGTLRLVQENSF